MPALNFTNISSGNSSLYLAPQGIYWCAFLLPKGKTILDSSISFADSAQYQGYYIFSAEAPKDISAFVSNIWAFFEPPKLYQAGAIVWVQSADQIFTVDSVQSLYLQANTAQSFKLLVDFNLNFGNNFSTFTLSAGSNPTIELDTDNNRFVINGPPSGLITFKANTIASQATPQNVVEIPLTGMAMGGFRFLTGLNHSSDFRAFDTASKYFYNTAAAAVTEISYPPFAIGSPNDQVQFQVSINPIDLLNQKQLSTYLAFLGSSINTDNDESSPTIMASNFRSDYGIPINFLPYIELSTSEGSINIPSSNSAALIFSERASSDPIDNWYTILSGYYTLAISDSQSSFLDKNKQLRLLNGLAGTESISITPQTSTTTGDFIAFKGLQPSFVQQFPIVRSGNKVGSNTTQQPLLNTYITAWAGIIKGTAGNSDVVYHSQPQGGSLYSPNSADMQNQFLDYYVANSGTLSTIATVYFPMVGYGFNTFIPVGVDVQQFELQILAPQRKLQISEALLGQSTERVAARKNTALRSAVSDTLVDSTSPQGFYIQIDEETSTWETMQLASNQFIKSDGSISPIYNLQFNNLGAKLQSAFQTNQLFLVASSDVNSILGDFASSMEIEEWPFNLNITPPESNQPNTGQYSNVVIFKYCNESLQDRVKNIQFWTNPEDFNDTNNNGLPNLSNWISDYIEKGITKFNNGDDDYLKFNTVATDRNWKGVIALKVDISLTTFPPELQGLLAGIDVDEFNAHHFGIDLSVVKNETGSLKMQPTSSLFALIDYEDDTFQQYDSNIGEYKSSAPINTSVDYVYNVLLLKVLFSNSKITNFNSYIAFTINALFGEKVLTDTRDNLLILNGTYENHNGVPSYTFSATGDSVLQLDSVIIQDVEILKANFVTSVGQEGNDSGKVLSRFSFFGYLNFYSLNGFDLLSFGSENDSSANGQGIAFSNMYIDLSFPLEDPNNQLFVFDIGSMSFDIGSSYARENSLYRHFPLQLSGIVSGTKDNNPVSQGYLNVQLPSLKPQGNLNSINGGWYGLAFKLNMGTLGSLASAAGFNTTFLACWNVGGMGVVAGLKLPGVNPQAPALSLQGVLKMDIGSVSIQIADDGVSYLMKINNIALKVLSLTFPPGGQIGFFLFGNPATAAPPESLGWYAAYVKK